MLKEKKQMIKNHSFFCFAKQLKRKTVTLFTSLG